MLFIFTSLINILLFNVVTLTHINTDTDVYFTTNFTVEYSSPGFFLQAGTPYKNQSIQLSLTYPYTWMSFITYNNNQSSTSELINNNVEFPSDNYGSLIGLEVKDIISFPESNISLNNFSFFILRSKSITFHFSILSLSKSYNDTKYSIIHQLYNEGIIGYKSFTLEYIEANNGILYLGKYPQYNTKNHNRHQFTCKTTLMNNNFWGCDLTMVTVGVGNKKYYFHNKYVSHFSASSQFIVPDEFLLLLKETYFKSALENNICKFSSLKRFECDTQSIKNFGDLIFVFESTGLLIHGNELWNNLNSFKSEFVMYGGYNVYSGIKNEWYIGKALLDKFTVTFDYEKDEITFSATKERIIYINLFTMIRLFKITSFLLIINILIICLFKLKTYI